MNELSGKTLLDGMRVLNFWDYGIIIFYGLLIASIGLICRKLNKNPSDYFRGGGNMLWWVGAVSAMATGISTWTFTGGAAKCYLDGLVYPVATIAAVIPSILVLWFVGPRFRRLRVITAMEAVFRRFGMGTEQFYTWFTLPMGLFWGGIGINTLGVFMSSIFQMDLPVTIVVVGIIVTFLAVLGGQWAVSFFGVVQGIILLLVILIVAYFSVSRPEIGGLGNLTQALPEHHFDFGSEASLLLVWLWIGWQILFSTIGQMDLRNCGKFIRVKDDASTRKMVLMITLPGIVFLLPLITQLPSLCAAVVYPDLKAVFPQLKSPEEGAWLAMAMTVLPQGLLGLMVCTMFGAAADSADAALNSNAGFFVRNVYARYMNPRASDKNQVVIGKLTTGVFGLLTVGVALLVNSLRSLNLFDLFQILNAMLLPPMIVPMVLGLVIKRTPDWSGWSTVLVGLLSAFFAQATFTSDMAIQFLGLDRLLNAREFTDSQFLYVSLFTWGGSTLWFLGTMFFWNQATPEHRGRIDMLFQDLNRPVDHIAEGGENQDAMQYRIIGILALIMGVFLLFCILIPNPLYGRACFLLIGGILSGLGWHLLRSGRKSEVLANENNK
jgi:SSS family solute:Na+ symporter